MDDALTSVHMPLPSFNLLNPQIINFQLTNKTNISKKDKFLFLTDNHNKLYQLMTHPQTEAIDI